MHTLLESVLLGVGIVAIVGFYVAVVYWTIAEFRDATQSPRPDHAAASSSTANDEPPQDSSEAS